MRIRTLLLVLTILFATPAFAGASKCPFSKKVVEAQLLKLESEGKKTEFTLDEVTNSSDLETSFVYSNLIYDLSKAFEGNPAQKRLHESIFKKRKLDARSQALGELSRSILTDYDLEQHSDGNFALRRALHERIDWVVGRLVVAPKESK